ncbi:MAG: hypothetical protein AB7R77_16220 [Ilumatobacteraceae bacterium]
MRPVLLIVVGALVGGLLVAGEAAASGVGECVETDPFGFCVEWDVPTPGGPGRSGGSGGDEVECYWVTIDEDLAEDPTIWVDFGLDHPPDGVEIVWQSWECSDGRTTFNFRWVIPATPGNLAALARGRLVGQLPQPVVESSPPLGTASIVGVPVFVEVVNWTGVVSESQCAGGLCVTVSATPSLTYTPGEPGSSALPCGGSGSRYVPGAGSAEEQAAVPGACAHAYRLRTGAAGRPSVWPGAASVTWTLSWVATSGESGSLPSVTRATATPRAVSEVQTVISGGATP